MSESIGLSYLNYSKIKVEADPGILMEMSEHFSFFAPGYRFMPAYRSKQWDGKIKLLDMRTKTIPAGLAYAVQDFAKVPGRGYDVNLDENSFGTPSEKSELNREEFVKWVDSLTLTGGNGERITPRDYQYAAAYETLSNYRSLVISPTASGKSLVMYIVMRYVLQFMKEGKFIIIVPTTALTKQLIGDFEDYSKENKWPVQEMCFPIFAGQDKEAEHPVFVSTWQSMSKFPKNFFREVQGIIGDEAHTCTAKVVGSVIDNCINAKYRLGTTGTLDGTKVNALALEGMFGKQFVATTTREQIDAGNMAPLDISILKLFYPEEERKYAKYNYAEEVKVITKHRKRNRFVANLALKSKGNTLVIFRFIEHGEMLRDMIEESAREGRKIFYVDGSTDIDERNDLRAVVEKEKDAIIIASIGTFSTGINIRNLNYLILATPQKGRIKLLQSIGRTLRIATNGLPTKVYDICDDMSWKKRKNFALKHCIERIKQYALEKLKYKIYEINL